MKVLTVTRLMKLGACSQAVFVFRRTFGKQARLTAANMDKAERAGLSLAWLADRLKLIPDHDQRTRDGRCMACFMAATQPARSRRALLKAARG